MGKVKTSLMEKYIIAYLKINVINNDLKFQGSEKLIMKDHNKNRKFKGFSTSPYHQPTAKNWQKKIVIMSGRNSVGKSLISALLSWALSIQEEKILLVDCNFQTPSLKDFFIKDSNKKTSLNNQIIMEITDNLDLIPNDNLMIALQEFDEKSEPTLSQSLSPFISNYTYIVYDTQTGLNETNLELMVSSDTGILITTTDPTSILDTYTLIRTSLSHLKKPDFRLVMNKVVTDIEVMEMYDNLKTALESFLDYDIGLLGHIPFDTDIEWSREGVDALLKLSGDSQAVPEVYKISNLINSIKPKALIEKTIIKEAINENLFC